VKTSSSHFDGFTYLVCIFTKLIFMILACIYFILFLVDELNKTSID